MKKFLGLALAGALSVAALPAVAADYPLKAPPPPIWTWTGFYVGVQAGAGWGSTQTLLFGFPVTGQYQGIGGVAGGTLGANWQAPGSPWVFGIEGDFSWSGIKPTFSFVGFTASNQMDWFATVRGRLGHANGPLLFYVTGGVVFAQFNPILPFVFNLNYNDTGWTVGAGLEGALGGGWSLKAEYLYLDFGASPAFFFAAFNQAYYQAHIVRAGVNYKF